MTAVLLLRKQLQEAYDRLRTRVEGLTDDEFFWEPVPDCWTVRQDDRGHWAADYPDEPHPVPAPSRNWTVATRFWSGISLACATPISISRGSRTGVSSGRLGVCFGR